MTDRERIDEFATVARWLHRVVEYEDVVGTDAVATAGALATVFQKRPLHWHPIRVRYIADKIGVHRDVVTGGMDALKAVGLLHRKVEAAGEGELANSYRLNAARPRNG